MIRVLFTELNNSLVLVIIGPTKCACVLVIATESYRPGGVFFSNTLILFTLKNSH